MRGNSVLRRTRARATRIVIGGAATLVLLGPATAEAQEVNTYGGGNTAVTVPPADPADPPVSAGRAPSDPGGSTLPFTGGDVAGLAAIGVGAIGAGGLATRMRRRRPAV
jgi:hypothetical protein